MRQLTRRQRVSAIVLAVLALCFITLDLGGGSLRQAHAGVRGTLGSLYRGTDTVLGPARRWAAGVPDAGRNEGRIQALQHKNATLRGKLDARSIDHRVGVRIAALQRAADGSGHDVLPARVVAFGPGQGFDWTVTLDSGTNSGVRTGQTVTDGVGLVGRVLHADSDSSVVLLAADPGSGVGARDVRSGEIGVVTGAGNNGLVYTPIDPHAVIKVGDKLLTGPSRASSYVAGLELGTVESVRSSDDGTLTASVRPATDPSSLDLVGVILDSAPHGAGADVAAGTGTTGGGR